MTTTLTLTERLRDAALAGVRSAQPTMFPRIRDAAGRAGLSVIEVDFGGLSDKAGLLAELARAFALPDWFGHNWDALQDCLCDLSWKEANGYVVLLRGGKGLQTQAMPDFAMALDVLASTSDHWRAEGVPFWALIDIPQPGVVSLFAGT